LSIPSTNVDSEEVLFRQVSLYVIYLFYVESTVNSLKGLLLEDSYMYDDIAPVFKRNIGPSWSSSYDSLIHDYLNNQCLSPLTLWVRIPFRRGVLDTILCDTVCQWLAAVGVFFRVLRFHPLVYKHHDHKRKIYIQVLLNINDIIIFIIVDIGFNWNKIMEMNKYIQIRR